MHVIYAFVQDLVQTVTNDFKTELREENRWLLFASFFCRSGVLSKVHFLALSSFSIPAPNNNSDALRTMFNAICCKILSHIFALKSLCEGVYKDDQNVELYARSSPTFNVGVRNHRLILVASINS